MTPRSPVTEVHENNHEMDLEVSELLDMRLTFTSGFSWKPGFQERIRNLEMNKSPSQRVSGTLISLALRFQEIHAGFSAARARRAVIWITRTNVIFQLMMA